MTLFAREPAAGRVKTRLARDVGEAAAAALYAAFLEDLAAALPDPARWESVLAHAEPEAGPTLSRTFGPPAWSFVPQGEGSLGERLGRVFEWSRARGVDVVVAGSDAPTLSRDHLEAAFVALEDGAEVVFAPSPDGGFSLIGARPGLARPGTGDFFEGVGWSTAHALEDCRSAAERRGLRVQLLTPVPDVDEAEDLAAVSLSLSKNLSLAPSTRRVLEAMLQRRGP